MATTMHFEETILDEAGSHKPIKLELGTMTALKNGGNLYLRINDGDAVLVDRETAKRLVSAVDDAAVWLGIRAEG